MTKEREDVIKAAEKLVTAYIKYGKELDSEIEALSRAVLRSNRDLATKLAGY